MPKVDRPWLEAAPPKAQVAPLQPRSRHQFCEVYPQVGLARQRNLRGPRKCAPWRRRDVDINAILAYGQLHTRSHERRFAGVGPKAPQHCDIMTSWMLFCHTRLNCLSHPAAQRYCLHCGACQCCGPRSPASARISCKARAAGQGSVCSDT